MKCFNHPEVDAVGICKSCNRGLCPECIAPVGRGISCRNRCESDVAALNELVERGRTAYQKTSKAYFRSSIFTVLLGSVFVLLGMASVNGGGPNLLLMVMGVLCVGWGISHFVSGRRIGQK